MVYERSDIKCGSVEDTEEAFVRTGVDMKAGLPPVAKSTRK